MAETEYALFREPAHSRVTPFGTFVHHPAFPTRYDCNQLVDARCPRGATAAFFRNLTAHYAGLNLGFRKISGHDPVTLERLAPVLAREGWQVNHGRMTVFRGARVREANPAVTVRAVDPFNPDLETAYIGKRVPGVLDMGFQYHRTQTPRVGGEWLVAYQDGQPVGTAGWYVVGRLARFRFIGTLEHARSQGVATTLIRHVQEHPVVRQQDALVIFVNDDGPVSLYEDLGFRTVGRMWETTRFLPGFED